MEAKSEFVHYFVLGSGPFDATVSPKDRFMVIDNADDIREEDVVIWSYPGAGARATAELVYSLWLDVCLLGTTTHDGFSTPCGTSEIEISKNYKDLSNTPPPRVIVTHLPFDQLPQKVKHGHIKIIYITRDPRDVAISLYNRKMIPHTALTKDVAPLSWTDFFESFMRGSELYGTWFDHIQSCKNNRKKLRLLELKFEEMEEDILETAADVRRFLGKSFEYMPTQTRTSNCEVTYSKEFLSLTQFFGAGSSGRWKKFFTVGQSESFDSKLETVRASTKLDIPYWPYSERATSQHPIYGSTYRFQGVLFSHSGVPLRRLEKIYKYSDVRSDDVFICTFMKAGTHWAADITNKIVHDGSLVQVNVHEPGRALEIRPDPQLATMLGHAPCDPESYEGLQDLSDMPSPRVILTHLLFRMLPRLVQRGKGKVIYVYRNPRDMAASMLHMLKKLSAGKVEWPEFFNVFMQGQTVFGSWWDHFKSYQEKKTAPNVLSLFYEDMKEDLPGTVRKIAEFIGKSLSEESVAKIAASCTVQETVKANPNSPFVRKGVSGDWKNLFTVSQSEELGDKIRSLKEHTGFDVPY